MPGTWLEIECAELTEVQPQAFMLLLEMKEKGLELDFYLSITSLQVEKTNQTNIFSDVQTSLQKSNMDTRLESPTQLRTPSTVACMVVNPSSVSKHKDRR